MQDVDDKVNRNILKKFQKMLQDKSQAFEDEEMDDGEEGQEEDVSVMERTDEGDKENIEGETGDLDDADRNEMVCDYLG